MGSVELRAYQERAISETMPLIESGKKTVLVLPTGAGKTVIATEIVRRLEEQGKRVLFVAHRVELLEQTQKHYDSKNVAGDIKSKQAKFDHGDYDYIVVDEAHHCTKDNGYSRFFDKTVLGLTATPWRLDRKGLGDIFDELVVGVTCLELFEDGYLIKPRFFQPKGASFDASKCKISMGDYVMSTMLSDSMIAIAVDVVKNYKERAQGKKAIAYCVDVAHARKLAERFKEAGIKCESIAGSDDSETRRRVIGQFRAGEIDVITNCMILTEGFDVPDAEVAILARPTASSSLYLQMIGRVMRPSEGKTSAIVFDHAGNIMRHGMPQDYVNFSLTETSLRNGKAPVKQCPQCSQYVPLSAKECDECGYVFPHESYEGKEVVDLGGVMDEVQEQEHDECKACRSHATKEVKGSTEYTRRVICLKCKAFSTISLGVDTSEINRADKLESLIRENCDARGKPSIAAFRYFDIFGDWPSEHFWSQTRVKLEDNEDHYNAGTRMMFFVRKQKQRA